MVFTPSPPVPSRPLPFLLLLALSRYRVRVATDHGLYTIILRYAVTILSQYYIYYIHSRHFNAARHSFIPGWEVPVTWFSTPTKEGIIPDDGHFVVDYCSDEVCIYVPPIPLFACRILPSVIYTP